MNVENEVKIGKGKLMIPDSISRDLGNFWILIQVTQRKGPCKDEVCQLIEEVDVKISVSPLEGMVIIDNNIKLNIAADKTFLDSVDKGRKTVRLCKSLNRKIKVKGF
jgi:transposase